MKHHLDGLTHTRAPRMVSLTSAALWGATLFGAGFCCAIYTIGLIVTAR